MTVQVPFEETFDTFDTETTWIVSEYVNGGGWIDTTWSAENVSVENGTLALDLNGLDGDGKRYTGGEIKSDGDYFYGRYEVVMRPSGVEGALSSFFVYTGAPFGQPTSEIDFEFIGGYTTQVLLTFHTPEGSDGILVDLGFDAALADHTYAFEWGPNSISWYADDVLLRSVVDPEIGIPAQPGNIHASIWTGSNSFTGIADNNVDTSATYGNISYTPRQAPGATQDQFDLAADQSISLNVLANDYFIDDASPSIAITIATQPASGTASVDPNTNEIIYTPNNGFRGEDSFSYTISDSNGQSTGSVETSVYVGDPIAPGADLLTEGDDIGVALTSGNDFVDALAGNDEVFGDRGNDIIYGNAGNDTIYGMKNSDALYGGSGDDTLDGGSGDDLLDGGTGNNTLVGGKSFDTFVISTLDSFNTIADWEVNLGGFGENLDVSAVLTGYVQGVSILSNFVQITQTGADAILAVNPTGTGNPADFVDVALLQNYNFSTNVASLEQSGALVAASAGVPGNQAPVAVDDTVDTTQQAPVIITVLGNDSDPDGDSISVVSITQPAGGSAVLNGDGTITYTSNPGFSGIDTLSYTIIDANGATATANVNVDVADIVLPPNDAPIAGDDTAIVAEDGTVDIAVLTNDSDPNSDPLSVATLTTPANGTATINGDGTINYTPNADFSGTDSFDYTLSDGRGGLTTATVTVTVSAAADAPVAQDDQANTAEETPIIIDVLANDSDADGDTLSISATESAVQAQSGTVTTDGTTLTYAPDPAFSGTDSFSYTVADGNGGFSTATVTVNVGTNDPIAPGADLLTEGDDIGVALTSGNDFVDALAGNDEVFGDRGNDIIYGNAGNDTIYGMKNSDALYGGSGDDTLDGGSGDDLLDGGTGNNTLVGGKSFDTFVISTLDSFNTIADWEVNLGGFGENLDVSAVLTGYVQGVSILSNFVQITQTGADAILAVNPTGTGNPADFVDVALLQNYNFSTNVASLEQSGALVAASAGVPGNQAPVAVDDTVDTTQQAPVIITVLGNDSDPDGDSISVVSITQPAGGSAVLNGDGTITYTSNQGFSGIDTLSYTIIDANGATATANVNVDVADIVLPPNDAPIAGDDTAIVAEDGTVDIAVLTNDSDPNSDPLSVATLTTPANGTATINGDGTINYTPNADFSGTDSFDYTLSDGRGGLTTATVTVTVSAAADAPVAQDDQANTAEETPIIIDVLANDSDADGDTLSISATESAVQAQSGTVTTDGTTLTYAPDPAFSGTDSFSYTVADGNGGFSTATVTVNVGTNDPIAPGADLLTEGDDIGVALTSGNDFVDALAGNDEVFGDRGNDIIYGNAGNDTIYGMKNSDALYGGSGDDTLDGGSGDDLLDGGAGNNTLVGGKSFDTFVISTLDSFNTIADWEVNLAGFGENLDVSAVLTGYVQGVSILSNFVQITQTGADAILAVNPTGTGNPADFVDVALLQNYNFSTNVASLEQSGALVAASAGVPGNQAPVAVDDTVDTTQQAPVIITVLGNDSDPDGDSISVVSITQPAGGSAVLNGDGTITYTSNQGFSGIDTLSYTIIDANGATATANVNVDVADIVLPPNDAPIAGDDTAIVAEDGTVDIAVLTNDSDPNSDPLSVATLTTPANGTATINGDGTINYTPNADFSGTDSFDYTLSDGRGGLTTATVTVTVSAAADAPVAQDDQANTAEETPIIIDVLANDSDADGDTLSISATESAVQAQSGTVTTDGTTLTYAPDPAFSGTDSFSYTVADGNGGFSTATVTVNVGTNDPIAPGADLLTEGDDIGVALTSGNDFVDALAGNDEVFGDRGNDIIYGNAGNDTIYGMKNSDALYGGSGDDTLDGGSGDDLLDGGAGNNTLVGGKSFDTFVISTLDSFNTIADWEVNLAGFGENLDVSAVLTGYVQGVSILSNFVQITQTGADAILAVNPTGTGNPADFVDVALLQNYNFSTNVASLEQSGALVAASAGVPGNQAPVAVDDTVDTTQQAPVIITVLGNDSDPDGDSISVVSITQPAGGSAVLNGDGTITYTSNQGFSGIDTLSYTIIDANGATATANVNVDVIAGNTADDDANMAITVSDTLVDLNDAQSVQVFLTGLDSDATAIITVSDGNSAVQAMLLADGSVSLDLSGLNLGNLTTQVIATDQENATSTVNGPDISLVAAGADDDGNMTLSAPDTTITIDEVDAVSYSVAGLDADATALLTVSDGTTTVTAPIGTDGSVSVDLTGFADGAITSTLVATDVNGAITSVTGPVITLDTAPRSDFSGDTRALSINLEAGSYSAAAKVLVIGDSLSVGFGDVTQPYDLATLEGWREDLFEDLQSQDIWIDYVGNLSNGPERMLDPDHSAEGGISINKILDGRAEDSNIIQNAVAHDPDVLLFMAGTNDYNITNFFNRFQSIVTNTLTVVDQFFANAPSPDAHMVVTIPPPKTKDGPEQEVLAEYLAQGYSTVDGNIVAGDAGLGNYVPGLIAAIEGAQQIYANLHLFENPLTVADLTPDLVHFTQAGYAIFAEAMADFIETEIGFASGTLDGTGIALEPNNIVLGGEAGDLIVGNSQDNTLNGNAGNDVLRGLAGDDQLLGDEGIDRIEGGAGVDTLTGGAGADAFIFNTDFADGHAGGESDLITDFDATEDWLVFDATMDNQITVSDGLSGTVVLSVASLGEITVQGPGAQSLKGTDLGGGVFGLVDDPLLITFEENTAYLLS